MGLSALFAANNQLIHSQFGVGVTANSVILINPDGTQYPITKFVFENDSANQLALLPAGDDAGENGRIDIAKSYQVDNKTSFRIDGQIWQFAGFGGEDPNSQTILLHLPRRLTDRQMKTRGS